MNEIVYIKSKQPGIRARHYGNPNYEIMFNDEPVAVLKCVAEHLLLNPNFEIVENTEDEKPQILTNQDEQNAKKSQKKALKSKKEEI